MDALRGDVAAFKRELRLAVQEAKAGCAKHDDVTAVQRAGTDALSAVKSQMTGKAATSDVHQVQRKLDDGLAGLSQRLDAVEGRLAAPVATAQGTPMWLSAVALLALLGCAVLAVMLMRMQHRMRKMHLP